MATAAAPGPSICSPESFIGCPISLITKSEIRYEGLVSSLNTVETSIGLCNVRSFGTEGRKKDGPQVPQSNTVYDYILFRGSDIKDIQVKATLPTQIMPSMYNDPAIIQTYGSQAAVASPSLPTAGARSLQDPNASLMGIPNSTFQGSVPLYQPNGSPGSWGSAIPPMPTNDTGLTIPMYSQGFYGVSNGLEAQQQSLLPPHGLSISPSVQQSVHTMNASLPTGASNLSALQLSKFPPPMLPSFGTGTLNLPPSLPSWESSAVASGSSTSSMPTMASTLDFLPAISSTSMPLVSPSTIFLENITLSPTVPYKPTVSSSFTQGNGASEPELSVAGTSGSFMNVGVKPPLVTPGQLLQPRATKASSSPSSQTTQKDVPIMLDTQKPILPLPSPPVHKPQPTKASSSQSSRIAQKDVPTMDDSQGPILPLPSRPVHRPWPAKASSSQSSQTPQKYVPTMVDAKRPILRLPSPPVHKTSPSMTGLTEDFDFMAMNEKFNKEEIWGHLGKSNKVLGIGHGSQNENGDGQSKSEGGYVKDDFFDSLSSNALDSNLHNGKTKLSERMKMDAKTFGDSARHQGGRGGSGLGRGGYSRGAYYPKSHGYTGRGKGHQT
ncbi:Protein decapping like [Actinidia chinensis var. chinensis]|uniref:Protein decapping like n=1 Tax=Actinidia chinensis var. chinensis TaxID=1590841 RepID=A0A2R6RKL6_ACTCC|nr:Protein decapping like [Actinidia chinensis var. chinensis]